MDYVIFYFVNNLGYWSQVRILYLYKRHLILSIFKHVEKVSILLCCKARQILLVDVVGNEQMELWRYTDMKSSVASFEREYRCSKLLVLDYPCMILRKIEVLAVSSL